MSDGKVIISTELDNSQLKKGLSDLSSTVKKIGGIIAAAFSVRAIVNFSKQAIELGSNVQEVQNVVDTAFGDMAYKVEEFAKTSVQNFGMSKLSAKKTASTYMAMARGMGIAQAEASDMAISLTGLTGDVASFYNISQELADIKLRSVFTGETETLKDLGIVMTQTNLQAFALSQGISKNLSDMSQAELAALRYKFVMQQLALANGDFAKTQDSWANQTRILSEQWKEFMSIIGQVLITIFTPLVRVLNTIVAALINMANVFNAVISVIFGTSNKQIQQVQSSASGVGSAIGESVDNQNALTDATKGTTAAQKKSNAEAKKTLAAFDEINKLSDNSASGSSGSSGGRAGSGGGGSSVGGGLQIVESDPLGDGANKLIAFFETLKRLAEEFKTEFSQGFQNAFGKVDFSAIRKSIQDIRKSLKEIFTDPAVTGAAFQLFQSWSYALGSITGMFASIGVTIAQNLLGGIGTYLSKNAEYIKQSLTDIFTVNAETFDIVSDFSAAIADIFAVFRGKTAQNLTADIIEIFSNGFLGAVELASKIGRDVIDAITAPIIANKDKFKTAIENTLKPIETVAGTIADAVTNTWVAINETYDKYVKPAFENLKEGWISVYETLLDGYNKYIAPVLSNLANKFRDVFQNQVQPAIDTVIDVFGKLIFKVSEVWKQYFVPFINWLNQTIIPIFATVFEGAATVVLDALGGICDFISGVFSGDLKKALNGLKEVIKAPLNGIISIVEKAVNWIIEKINTLHWDIPDWVPGVGGSSFGFNFSRISIPRLAQGAVIPPNREFLAVLGDQSTGTNIEAPLETIKQALAEVIAESGGTGGEITLRLVAGKGFVRDLRVELVKENSRRGVKLVRGGALT